MCFTTLITYSADEGSFKLVFIVVKIWPCPVNFSNADTYFKASVNSSTCATGLTFAYAVGYLTCC